MNNNLHNLIVKDRQTFIEFLSLLREDFLNNPESWENITIPDFLEALAAYTQDSGSNYNNKKQVVETDKPTWQILADLFRGAKIYE